MKNSIITLWVFLLGFINFAIAQGNYFVIINQDTVSVNMNQAVQYKTDKGENLTLKITQPDVLTYSDDMVSFSHDKNFSVSNSVIDEGIDQCMIMSSTGNGFMVQKYRTIDPSSLTRLMLNELTKESITYGYEKSETEFKKQLKSGQSIEGIQATLTYKGDKEVYTVATYGKKDEGIIVVTMLLNEDYPRDKEIIDLFLETLQLKNL